jgi:hypothetical protein
MIRRLLFAALACAVVALPALADPLPGETLKFLQMPLNGGLPLPIAPPAGSIFGAPAPFPGHDELSTAWLNRDGQTPLTGQFMADDFADNFNSPVVHVQWWGSYMNNSAPGSASNFLIAFEDDVPASAANGFSHPGPVLLSQIVTKGALTPASGTFTETFVPAAPGSPDGNLFQYNAELALPFQEQAGHVYWLKIVALDPTHAASEPGALQWGWHDRDWGIKNLLASPVPVPGEHDEGIPGVLSPVWHFQDDAVNGAVGITPAGLFPGAPASVLQNIAGPTNYVSPWDGPTPIATMSKDLAFGLYTIVPEPSTLVLVSIGIGAMALSCTGKRRAR